MQSARRLVSYRLLLCLLVALPVLCQALSEATVTRIENAQPTSAVLFPWIVEVIGVVVFFLLTRFELPVPYAAIMFLVGVGLGYGALSFSENIDTDQELDQFTESILQWTNINSGVLLLVFLPGLIFRDAIEVNFALFMKALPQLLILAFPMVLVGTVLIALVAHYALPYEWPLSLTATLGAILSSTDPVAVGSVLKSAGAPPRLQMHISGESLLNDGSAVVFFSIFSTMYLAEYGVGETIDWGEGCAIFIRMALGGTAVGFMFAAALLQILCELDRRLEPEYNVLQVVTALSFAYLSYYVSEQVCNMSGVIACVVCGITARALGRGMITDNKLMDSYLALMEYLLNTFLFTLGGVVYGKAIRGSESYDLQARDWVYLLLFYFFVMAIRLVQVTLFYPVLSSLGLKSNWRETLFLGFGGLRGAVSVALALSLERLARESFDDPNLLSLTRDVEFFAGGVTFLTLFINGTLAATVLKQLGLVKPTISRKRTLRLFKESAESFINQQFCILMKEKRFHRTDYAIVQDLVPFLKGNLSPQEFSKDDQLHFGTLTIASKTQCPEEILQEIRALYLTLLKEAYGEEVSNNELNERDGNGLNLSLLRQSVAFAAADNDHQEPMHDWQYTRDFRPFKHVKTFFLGMYASWSKGRSTWRSNHLRQEERAFVLRAISFIEAHESAGKKLTKYAESKMNSPASGSDRVTLLIANAVNTVLEESGKQVVEAEEELERIPASHIDNIVSYHVATILLRRLADFVERRATDGFLTKKEARHCLHRIDMNIAKAQEGRSDDATPVFTVGGTKDDFESHASSTEVSEESDSYLLLQL